jgi:hypothetical protein
MLSVKTAIDTLSSAAGRHSYAALELDLALFCEDSAASESDKREGID